MKYCYSIFMVCLLSFFYANSQGVKYVTFDYLNDSDQIYSNSEIKNSRVGVKISNINKKLVDINNNVEKTTFNEEVPKIFETFSNSNIPDTMADPGAGLMNQDGDIFEAKERSYNFISEKLKNDMIAINRDYKKIDESIEEISESIILYGTDYDRMKTLLQYHKDVILLQNICNSSFSEIIAELNKLTQNTFSSETTGISDADRLLLARSSEYVRNKTILNRIINTIINDSNEHYKELSNRILPSKLNEIRTRTKEIVKSLEGLEKSLKKIKSNDENLKELINKISVIRITNGLENKLLDITSILENIDMKKIFQDFEQLKETGKKDLFGSYDYFNISNYTYYVNPESISDDINVFTITIKPKDNVPCAPIPRTYEVRIRAKGGIKIDFSSGLFGNFGGNDFLDQSYKYENVEGEPDKSKIVRNDNKNSVLPSAGALMHIYKRSDKNVHLAGSFGLSTKDLDEINYHFGGSLIFGYNRRFIFSLGFTLTKSDLISDEFKVGQILDNSDAPDEIPTDTFNRFGYFLSFTYNLSSK